MLDNQSKTHARSSEEFEQKCIVIFSHLKKSLGQIDNDVQGIYFVKF